MHKKVTIGEWTEKKLNDSRQTLKLDGAKVPETPLLEEKYYDDQIKML